MIRTFKPGDTLEIVPGKWKDSVRKGTLVKVLSAEDDNLVRIKWLSGLLVNYEHLIHNRDSSFRVVDIPLPAGSCDCDGVKYDTYKKGGN